ncbi:hypothetical protein OF83DRAFT_1115990 [Amylostereum chailletii]|nr:hypothetical protein OF83DRAFT_1115990 [Amylostereum chailletii]
MNGSGGRKRDLVESFNALALSGNVPPPPPPAPGRGTRPTNLYPALPTPASAPYPYPTHGFVGGFRPGSSNQQATPPRQRPPSGSSAMDAVGLPPLPRPPAMPKPHHAETSLTMQHALETSGAYPVAFTPPRDSPRPYLTGASLAPPLPAQPHRPYSDPAPGQSAFPATPAKQPINGKDQSQTPQPPKLAVSPPHRRTVSAPVSPSPSAPIGKDKDGVSVQCNGVTAAGNRCRKQVKISAAKAETGGDVFCHQHEKKMQEPSGFYERKSGATFIKFDDWIPGYLQPSTQASLRSEMQKAKSDSDEDGYIYTFEILDPADPSVVHLKVGRATNLNRRMDQWSRQCGSKEQILRGHWPDGLLPDQASLMKGLIQAGNKGPWCHRLERLVHLELADLAAHSPYTDPKFPNSVSGNDPAKRTGKGDIKRCPDCGKNHKEIFSFERVTKGRYKGREWDLIVKPVIEKWGGFVEAYV